MKKLLITILIAGAFTSCSNYYRVIAAPEPTKSDSYNNFQDSMKYYVLRNGSEAFAMKNIAVSSDGKYVQCTLVELPFEHKLHANGGMKSKMRYKTKSYTYEDETGVLNEVHIYLLPGSKTALGAYTLAFANVQRVELIEKDKIKTRNSHALGIGIGISTAVLLLGGIAAAIYSSISWF